MNSEQDFRDAAATSDSVYDFDVFISYRHVDNDRRWACWLHTALETYRFPSKLVRELGLTTRLRRVFRDEEELSASADLSRSITEALSRSQSLIVVCSTQTPGSQWVNAEVERFRMMRGGDRILVLLIDGDPKSAFPRSLLELHSWAAQEDASSSELCDHKKVIADVRVNQRTSERQRKRDSKLKALAFAVGIPPDDLNRLDAQRDRQQSLFFTVALSVFFIGIAFLVSYVSGRYQQRRESENVAKAQQKLLVVQRELTNRERARVQEESLRAEEQQRQRRWTTYSQQMKELPELWRTNERQKVAGMLERQVPRPGSTEEDVRGIEWHYWRKLVSTTEGIRAFEQSRSGNATYSIAISPDEQLIAVANQQSVCAIDLNARTIKWREQITPAKTSNAGQEMRHAGSDNSIAFSSDGMMLAATCWFNRYLTEYGNTPEDAQLKRMRLPRSFIPGPRIGTLRVLASQTGDCLFQIVDDERVGGRAILFSPDRQSVVVDSNPWVAWNLDTKAMIAPSSVDRIQEQRQGLVGQGKGPAPSFHFEERPRGLILNAGTGRRWTWPEGKELDASDASRRLNSTGPIRVKQPKLNPTIPATYRVAELASSSVCFDSLDGFVATGQADGIVRVESDGNETLEFRGNSAGQEQAVALSASFVASISGGNVVLWKRDLSDQIMMLPRNARTDRDPVGRHFSADARYRVVSVPDGGVSVLDTKLGNAIANIPEPNCTDVCMSSTGRLVALIARGTLSVYVTKDLQCVYTKAVGEKDWLLGFDGSERRVMTQRQMHRISDGTTTDMPQMKLTKHESSMLISKDGRRLFLAARERLYVCAADDAFILAEVMCRGIPDLDGIEDIAADN